jgi:hypothetical protein
MAPPSEVPATEADVGKPDKAKPVEKVEPKPPPPPKTEPKYFFHSRRILDGIVVVWGLCALLVARYFRPGFWSTLLYAAAGLPIGLALSFLFFLRHKNKQKVKQLVCYCT